MQLNIVIINAIGTQNTHLPNWTQGQNQGLFIKDQDQDKDKDFTIKDRDQNKDCNFVLKDSLWQEQGLTILLYCHIWRLSFYVNLRTDIEQITYPRALWSTRSVKTSFSFISLRSLQSFWTLHALKSWLSRKPNWTVNPLKHAIVQPLLEVNSPPNFIRRKNTDIQIIK